MNAADEKQALDKLLARVKADHKRRPFASHLEAESFLRQEMARLTAAVHGKSADWTISDYALELATAALRVWYQCMEGQESFSDSDKRIALHRELHENRRAILSLREHPDARSGATRIRWLRMRNTEIIDILLGRHDRGDDDTPAQDSPQE